MKKMLLLFAIPFYLFACSSSNELKKYPEIKDPKIVEAMVNHYKKLPHDSTNTILWVTLPTAELRKLDKYKHDVRFIVAAYLETRGYKKKDAITLIMQLWRNDVPYYYDLSDIFQTGPDKSPHTYAYKVICPPPYPCDWTAPPTE